MDFVLSLLLAAVVWRVLCLRYQRGHIALLAENLSGLQLERHMETLTEGYARAIREDSESRQLQVFDTFGQTERTLASQLQMLANNMQKEEARATAICTLPFCLPFVERLLPWLTRDFRALLRIHAAGLRHIVDNQENLSPKDRAFHLSAELYLFQHSCHWFCKSRSVADARLMLRHKVDHRKVLESVTERTRRAYLGWLQGTEVKPQH
ncbi:MAG TPA: hypothetical protein VKZ70_11615 [Burkholderiaceae bacterium]|nr:hypothetical protein [Burkholderiaceae bacterium]